MIRFDDKNINTNNVQIIYYDDKNTADIFKYF